jgi:phosphate transport system substrate-binding protein
MRRSLLVIVSLLVSLAVLLSACAPQTNATPTQAAEPTQGQAVENTPAPTNTTEAEEIPNTAVEATPTSELSNTDDTDGWPEVDPGEVTGNIITAGSSTVYPLTEAIVKLFIDEGYTDRITIDSIGSGAGFERFCNTGETDVSNASRPIKESEVESCRAIGREPIEFRVGTDALAIVVNPDNDFLTDVTEAELAQLFSAGYNNWSDVNPAWPNEPIRRYSPGTDSGTYDYFIEEVMQPAYEGDNQKAREAFQNASLLQQSEDDNILVQGIRGDLYAIGYFGYAYYHENEGALNILSVDGVGANEQTTETGEYPLARPLFIYSDATIMREKPQVADFINFYLSRVNEVVLDVGYFPASDAALQGARQAWLEATR